MKRYVIVLTVILLLLSSLVSCGRVIPRSDETEKGNGIFETAGNDMTVSPEESQTDDLPDILPDPDHTYGELSVALVTDGNRDRFSALPSYNVSAWEYNFTIVIKAEADINGFRINRLLWNDEWELSGEDVIEKIGDLSKGEAILLTTDSVEIIGYVGVSYEVGGETHRFYPATSGKDGSAVLVETELVAEETGQIEEPKVITDFSDISARKNDDDRYKWVAAFLERDCDTLFEMTSLYSYIDDEKRETVESIALERLGKLENVSFGGFRVEELTDEYGNDCLMFDFSIVSGECEEFPTGEYSFIVYDYGIFSSPAIATVKRAGTFEIEDEDEEFFASTIFHYWYPSVKPEHYYTGETLMLFYLYEMAHPAGESYELTRLTEEQLLAIADEVYGVDFEFYPWSFDLHEGENGEEDYYTVRGMGGVVEYHDLISRKEDGDTLTYEVRYYADSQSLITSNVIRYTVKRTDSVYGFKLIGVELVYDTEIPMFTQGM